MQDAIGAPSTITVHVPQAPIPQPCLVSHAQVFAQDVDQQAVVALQGDFDRVAVQGETDQHPAWAPPGCPRY
jgi:hypothetical protein